MLSVNLDLARQSHIGPCTYRNTCERQSGFLAWIASLRLTLHRLALAGKVLRYSFLFVESRSMAGNGHNTSQAPAKDGVVE